MKTKKKIQNKIIGLKEFRENAEKYIKEVNKGKTFTVVRRSKPAFKMVPVDEWGDEGVWKTVVDFTKINPRGVPIEDVSRALKKLIKQDEQNRKISKKALLRR